MMLRIYLALWLAPALLPAQPTEIALDGRVLWTVKAARAAFTPGERAEDINANLKHVAEDRRMRLDEVREVRTESDTMLLIGRVYVFAVTDEDARVESKTRDALFAERRALVVDALARYRETHSSAYLIQAVAKSAGALVVTVLLLIALRLLYRRIRSALESGFRRFSDRGLGPVLRVFEHALLMILRVTLRLAAGAAALLIVFAGASYVLGLFPATAPLSGQALAGARQVLHDSVARVIEYLPNLLVLALLVGLTRIAILAARAMAGALGSGALSLPGFHREWAKPTFDLVRILLVLFGIVVAFPYLPGGESPALKGASIFIGVLVSLGSGSAMGNVISGVILTYMRPFREGDRVKIADTTGDVVEKALLVTRIRTIKNVEVIVPNSAILGAHIINYSANARENGLILHTTVTIGYDAPWPTVHRLLIAAALKTEGILSDPAPFVFQTSLNDYHVSYEINAFTNEANRMASIYSDLHRNIQEEFNAGGVEIMSPTFLSLRDGNTVTTPESHRPVNYVPPSFRVRTQGGKSDTASAG